MLPEEPLRPPLTTPARAHERSGKAKGTAVTRTVLVVDDHAPTVRLIASVLGDLPVEVRTAGNGAECLLDISRRRPDLIILDVVMPVMDGFQTLELLRQSPDTKDIPVVMLSGRGSDIEITEGWRLGVTSYLTKPFAVQDLTLLVTRILDDDFALAAEMVGDESAAALPSGALG